MSGESTRSTRDIAHDAKTYLLVIRMGLELIQKAKNDPAQIDQLVEMMREDGLAPITELISELLAKKGPGTPIS
jgi:hypothetical protein